MAEIQWGLLQQPDTYDAVQRGLLGGQQLLQNQNTLAQQQMQLQQAQRIEAARQAQAQLASNPQIDDAQFEQLLQPIAQADPAAAQQMRAQRQQSRDMASLLQDPSATNVARFGMRYPDAFKPMQEAWNSLNQAQRQQTLKTSADVYGLLQAGDAQGAIDTLQAHMNAAAKTGEDTSSYPQLINLIKQDPKKGLALAAINMSVGLGPDKFAENYKTVSPAGQQKMQGEANEAVAKGQKAAVEAQYAPQVIQSDLATEQAQRARMAAQTANEQADLVIKRDQLALDRDKLASGIQLELEKLGQNQTQVSEGGKTVINTAVTNSVAASQLADRMDSLASRMVGQNMASGWGAWMSTQAKDAFGDQNPVSAIRSEYQQIVNSQAIKSLPPGPASDKDIQLAKQGFPPANAGAQYIHDWLRGVAKMQRVVAAAEDRKANWVSQNGDLGPAKRDINVGGVMIPRGTTYTEFNGNAVKRSNQGALPESLSAIVNKYGGR